MQRHTCPGGNFGTLVGSDSRSQDFPLRIPMKSPESRVRTHQSPKNASWVYMYIVAYSAIHDQQHFNVKSSQTPLSNCNQSFLYVTLLTMDPISRSLNNVLNYLSAGLAGAGAAEGAANRSPSSSCSSSKSRLAVRGLAFSVCCLGFVILNKSSSSPPSSNNPPNLGFALLKIKDREFLI